MSNGSILRGMTALPVRVHRDPDAINPHLLPIVGIPDPAARETRIRCHSALAQLGRDPSGAIDVELPAKGATSQLDLPVAVAMAGAPCPDDTLLLGEVCLDGRLRPLRGVSSHLLAAWARGVRVAIIPEENEAEAGIVPGGPDVRVAATLGAVLAHLEGGTQLRRAKPSIVVPTKPEAFGWERVVDAATLSEIDALAQQAPKRILIVGTPGSGSMGIARHAVHALPVLSHGEAVTVTAIHSVAGLTPEGGPTIRVVRPFRAPHHTVSEAGLLGGGLRPGEVTLAHLGVLYLDQMHEFRRSTLSSLWAVLKAGRSVLGSGAQAVDFPAAPALVIGSVLPCACGYAGTATLRCKCSVESRRRYDDQIRAYSAHFDVTLTVPPVNVAAAAHS